MGQNTSSSRVQTPRGPKAPSKFSQVVASSSSLSTPNDDLPDARVFGISSNFNNTIENRLPDYFSVDSHLRSHVAGFSKVSPRPGAYATVFTWKHGGEKVFITGSFNNWQGKIAMRNTDGQHSLIMDLLPGRYTYKYIVDDQWRNAPDQPTVADEQNPSLFNNVVLVMDPLTEPPDPTYDVQYDDYTQEIPNLDYSTHPPNIPPQLGHIFLNSDSSKKSNHPANNMPVHVQLNHLYGATRQQDECMVLAISQRYKNKYVTTIFYMPFPETKKKQDSVLPTMSIPLINNMSYSTSPPPR